MSGQLAKFIGEYTQERERKFERLLGAALSAGMLAAGEKPCVLHRHGVAWVRVADGRDPFAVFVRAQHGDSWRHGTRALGTHLPAPYTCPDEAKAWAREVCRVLSDGGVRVRWDCRVITARQ